MKNSIRIAIILAILISSMVNLQAQKVGFMSSEAVRSHFEEAKAAEQRVQSIVDEWKRELTAMQQTIDNLEFEIRKNRLIWSDTERAIKDKEIGEVKEAREAYAKVKFEPNGEYDQIVKEVMKPIETKIYAAVQEISAAEGYDIIWDQSTQPLAYVNFKYDITVKILRKLGVDVTALEKEQSDKIKNDPRNEVKDTQKPRRRSRSKRDSSDDVKQSDDQEPEDNAPDQVEPAKPEERKIERKR